MILANISTPLLGLVDTAVMGHLDSARFLAAVALGGIIFNFIYWGFGFLRMGTTGLVAQAYGEQNPVEINAILFRALLLAWLIAALLLLGRQFIGNLAFSLLEGTQAVESLASQYYLIRIWSAPATMTLYVMTGWFLGMQNVKAPLLIVLVTNFTNIVLDIEWVVIQQQGIGGVARASVVAEYIGVLTAFLLMLPYRRYWRKRLVFRDLFSWRPVSSLLKVNVYLFIRTLSLIFAFAFFIAQSTRLGEVVLAANTVLLNFQTFMAYALDGFAHATEALVGKTLGEKKYRQFHQLVKRIMLWSFGVACGFVGVYSVFGEVIIKGLTSLPEVRQTATDYLPWIIVMPLLAFLSYLFDGVFVGATWSRTMCYTMIFAVFLLLLPVWYGTQSLGNHGLWLMMSVFMLGRSLSMAWIYKQRLRLFGIKPDY
jgi:MATE family multidrug resistance protein